MSEDSYPDIEIYVKQVDQDEIQAWLSEHFTNVTTESTASYAVTYDDRISECLIVPDAARGGFASIWFKSNHTPWETDRDCARDAYRYFQREVRCSIGSWKADEDGWLRIDKNGETVIAWQ